MTAICVLSGVSRTTMTRSTLSRLAKNSDSVTLWRRREVSRPSRRRWRFASSRVEPRTFCGPVDSFTDWRATLGSVSGGLTRLARERFRTTFSTSPVSPPGFQVGNSAGSGAWKIRSFVDNGLANGVAAGSGVFLARVFFAATLASPVLAVAAGLSSVDF